MGGGCGSSRLSRLEGLHFVVDYAIIAGSVENGHWTALRCGRKQDAGFRMQGTVLVSSLE